MKKNSLKINGKTQIAGIFGYPVSHSFSPAMHNKAYSELGLNIVYLPFCVHPKDIEKAVDSIRSLGLIGINITVPHKEKVLPFLDKISPLAKKIGSVNTIVNRNGRLTGFNTDAEGFICDLKSKGFNPKGKTAVVLGAGGGGKAVATALANAGSKTVYIFDTDSGLAQRTARKIKNVLPVNKNGLGKAIERSALLVNATPCGMKPGSPIPVSKDLLHKKLFVYDLVYNRATELLKAASEKGARTTSGLGMLLNQGTIAFELITGRKAPYKVMEKELENTIKNS